MYLHQKSVGSDRHGAAAQYFDEVSPSAPLTWIDDDRKVRFLLGYRHRCQIQRVARIGLEGSDPSLAEQDIWITLRKNIFGSEEPFFDPFAHAAFQQDRLLASGAFN
jgi:hypothetical protein